MRTSKQVADYLRGENIPVINVTEGNDSEDGEVTINERIHVQVSSLGDDLMGVVIEKDGKLLFSNSTSSLVQLVKQIRKALA